MITKYTEQSNTCLEGAVGYDSMCREEPFIKGTLKWNFTNDLKGLLKSRHKQVFFAIKPLKDKMFSPSNGTKFNIVRKCNQ